MRVLLLASAFNSLTQRVFGELDDVGHDVGRSVVADGDELRPRFVNARYLVPEADWHHYRAQAQPSALFREQVVPLEALGVMELVGGDHVISPSLTTVATPGHTPGHLSLAITSGGEHGFILGDVAIAPVEAHETDWVNRFDWDKEMARRTRHAVLDRLERERAALLPRDRLAQRQAWRDRRLMALAAHKRDAAAGE